MNKARLFKIIVSLALAACCMLACGCAYVAISEDRVQEGLADLDPEEGVARDITVTLYYRLTDERYLVGVTRNVGVRANEREGNAIIRTLLSGVPLLSGNVSALFGTGVSLVDVMLEGSILYVTLSREFLDETALNKTKNELRSFYEKNMYTQEEYEARVAQVEAKANEERALAVYSLVNTLTQYFDDGVRVQFLVDTSATGTGERLTRSRLGIAVAEGADSELVEPMSFVQDVVASASSVMDCALRHMQKGEYEFAYPLFAESENDESQKPAYAAFETEMLALGVLESYEIRGAREYERENYAYVYVDLKFRYAGGRENTIQNARLFMKREGDLYKVGHETYMRVLND